MLARHASSCSHSAPNAQSKEKDRPKTLALEIHHDGHHVTHYLPIEDYPTIFATFSFGRPRLLTGEPPKPEGIKAAPGLYGLNVDINAYTAAYTKRHGGRGVSFGKTHPGLYSRLLAKIAHCYVVAEYGLATFAPLLIELIINAPDDWSNLVGGDMDTPGYKMRRQETTDLHAIMIDKLEVRGKIYLVVTLQLFACLNAPTYYIVAGELKSPASGAPEGNSSDAGTGATSCSHCGHGSGPRHRTDRNIR